MKYRIYPALYSEIRMGIVWTTSSEIETNLIKIKNPANGKSIIAAHRFIDANYRKIYDNSVYTKRLNSVINPNQIIVDEYYRKKKIFLKIVMLNY